MATLQIDLIRPNRKLEQLERFKIHTWVYENGGRRREIGGLEVSVSSRRSFAVFGQHRSSAGGGSVGKGRGLDGGSIATGPMAGGALRRRQQALEGGGPFSREREAGWFIRSNFEIFTVMPLRLF
ncbi:hypothetical protein L3X38_042602 [Prunus dulcis]|uniref:Uncharacterized protein n=1 Tax=Prunus dulcis TaxID=3755 RepID=A0AAD4UVI8_PRUDU|nr:hypothetical protein L3X38_042602 [Prunus dulcis]